MIIKVKAILIAATIALVSCAGSGTADGEVNHGIDSLDEINDTNSIAEPDTSSIVLVKDECDVHFEAAMNREKPLDLIILNCSYWSSDRPIWLEHSFSFEIAENEIFLEDIIDYNQMVKMTDTMAFSEYRADWFLPKPTENYVGFYTEDDFDDFQVFTDLTTGTIYLRGSQY